MTAERWKQVRDLFDAVLDQPTEIRQSFLERKTAGDPDLRREVQELLGSYDDAGHMLTSPAAAGLESLFSSTSSATVPASPSATKFTKISTDTSVMEGRRIGQYRLIKKIDSGGMGTVFIAARDDHEFDQRVAIKVVRSGMKTEAVLQRFLQERRVLAGLEHQNIARLLDGGTSEDGVPYLVMEYVEGTPLDKYCDDHKLNTLDRVRLFRTVCDAVHYAHRSLVVHRDLKPANILVTADGVAKLLDFGIAKMLGTDSLPVDTGLTVDGAPMTPEYASPEQVQGQPITTASDVYALGVLLYRLLVGRSPYPMDRTNPAALFAAITTTDPQRPSDAALRVEDYALTPEQAAATREGSPEKLKRALMGDLDVILLTALRKDPERRYISAERLSDDLGRHLEGFPVSAQPDTLSYRASKFVRRHRTGVAVSITTAIALVLATVISVHYASVARREKAVAENRFQDVRKLARFVLLDFDDAIRSGETPARKVLVNKALEYLQELSKEAAGDPTLQRELVEGYLKIGGVQGDVYTSNLGDTAGALASYHRALDIAAQLAGPEPRNREDAILLARANRAVGDLVAQSGDRQQALKRYLRAEEILEKWSNADAASPTIPVLVDLVQRIGYAQGLLGDTQAELAHYTRAHEMAQRYLAVEAGNERVRKSMAGAVRDMGKVLSRLGRGEEALARMKDAERLFEQVLAANPEKSEDRRDAAVTSLMLGDTLSGAGRLADAAMSYRKALNWFEQLRKTDPQNRQYQRDTHIALGRLAQLLPKLNQPGEAREMTRRALDSLQPLVDLPDAAVYDLHSFVWLLTTTPFPDLLDGKRALPYAEKLVELTKSTDPGMLDALARAHFAAGNKAKAVEVEHKAVGLLPLVKPGEAPSALRVELETNLARFSR